MTVSYDATTHYGIRYYRDGSDTSSSQVEQHAAETIDNALHAIQVELDGDEQDLSDHEGVTDGTVHGINALIGTAVGSAISTAINNIIHSVAVPVVAINAGTPGEIPLWVAPAACTLQKVSIVPKAGIAGADTDYFTLSIVDKGGSGTGTDEIVSIDFPLGVDAAAFVAKNLGTLSVTHKVLAQGDVISFKKAESGSGMALPDLVCVIEYKLS